MIVNPKLLAAGGALYIGMSTATYVYLKSTKPRCCESSAGDHADTSSNLFDHLADSYDTSIDWDETLMGIKILRRRLIASAQGNVLEVSAGTGRNLSYYAAPAVTSLTLTDTSPGMLKRAWEKYKTIRHKEGTSVLPTRLALANVQHLCDQGDACAHEHDRPSLRRQGYGPELEIEQRFAPGSFDTVVDTFGLCSCENAVAALKEMAKAVRPGGKLLLLEHGRASWSWLNKLLDGHADAHHAKWGCRWNKDILELVREAQLEVISVARWHFGTTYVIEARPSEIKA